MALRFPVGRPLLTFICLVVSSTLVFIFSLTFVEIKGNISPPGMMSV